MFAKVLKILISIVFLVVIIVVGAIIALPYLVSTDAIRIRMAQDLSSWTGYNVQLSEAPKLNFFPSPRASLSGVTLTTMNDESAPLMEAERIDVNLSIFDAIMGRVSFSETRIIRPHFVTDEPVKTVADFFETLSRSQGTFGHSIREARDIVNQNPNMPDTTRLLNQPFGRIIIEDGELLYRELASDKVGQLTRINAVLDWPDSTRSVSFRLNTIWHGQFSELRINADQALLLLAGGKSQLRISFNSLRGGMTFDGMARLSENYFFDGQLSGRSPGWDQTLKWIGLRKTFGQNLTVPIVWESSFTAQPERIQMNDVTFTLGKDNARGALEVNKQNGVPTITGSLAFDSLNLNILSKAFFPDENKDEELDLSVLKLFGLDIRLSAPQAQFNNMTLTNLAAAIQFKNGIGIFDLGNANAFGGALQSNVQIIAQTEPAVIDGRISGSSIDMQSIMPDIGLPAIINAKTGFILNMKAPFSRWSEVLSKMSGQLTLNVSSGVLNGYDIDGAKQNLLKSDAFELKNNATLTSKFDRWNIEADILPNQLAITKSVMQIGEWEFISKGNFFELIKADDQTHVSLKTKLQKIGRSDSLCGTPDCIIRSLFQPVLFTIQGTLDQLRVIKNVNAL